MSFERELVLIDRNGDERACLDEAFFTHHQTLILVEDVGPRTRAGIVVPAFTPNSAGRIR